MNSPARNPHSDHPGHSAADCPCRLTINAQTSRTMNGYACAMTGGHCVPDPATCPTRVETFRSTER